MYKKIEKREKRKEKEKKKMPELPEVITITSILKKELVGKYIFSIKLDNRSRFHKNGLEGAEYLFSTKEIDENGHHIYKCLLHIEDIFYYGKKIFFRLKNERTNETIFFFSFLALSGIWLIESKNNKDNLFYEKLSFNVGRKGKIMKIFEDVIVFSDKSNFGNFKIFQTHNEYNYIIKDTGKMYINVEEEEFIETIRKRSYRDKEISWFLLEQKIFAGIGMYLIADILYKSEIKPDEIISLIEDDKLRNLFTIIKEIINESISKGGCSIRDYMNPYGTLGTYDTLVYGKEVDEKGKKISLFKTKKDKRTIYYVA
jgi:formamidopyrimidine-DNA glycosylase